MSLSQLAAWMPPSVKGDMDIPFDRKKIFVIFSSLKSKTSPTQIYLNFNNKAGH
jgi:hypothetical protein